MLGHHYPIVVDVPISGVTPGLASKDDFLPCFFKPIVLRTIASLDVVMTVTVAVAPQISAAAAAAFCSMIKSFGKVLPTLIPPFIVLLVPAFAKVHFPS